MRSHRTHSTIAAAATLAVILAGCGGDEAEPGASPTEPTAEQGAPDGGQDTAVATSAAAGGESAASPEDGGSTSDAAGGQGEDKEDQDTAGADEGAQSPGQGGSAGSSGDGSAEGGSTTEPVAGGQDGPGDAENLPTVPVEYADALVIAWGAGDQDAMAQLAPTGVVDVLGSQGGPHWDRTGSEGAAGSTYVTYQNTDSQEVLTLRVDNAAAAEGAPQSVAEARFSSSGEESPTVPTQPVDYGNALITAWGVGDQEEMQRLGTAEVVHILGDEGGPNWMQIGAEGAAGSTILTYYNSESDDTLTLRVDNAAASQGAEHAVVEARFETG